MQSSSTDSGACQLNRGQISCWCDHTCSANCPIHRYNLSLLFFCRKLISNSPAWCLDGKAKLLLDSQLINLDHNTINLVGQLLSSGFDTLDKVPNVSHR